MRLGSLRFADEPLSSTPATSRQSRGAPMYLGTHGRQPNNLLADAERTEDRAQKIIAAVASGDFTERVLRMPQFFGGQFAGSATG